MAKDSQCSHFGGKRSRSWFLLKLYTSKIWPNALKSSEWQQRRANLLSTYKEGHRIAALHLADQAHEVGPSQDARKRLLASLAIEFGQRVRVMECLVQEGTTEVIAGNGISSTKPTDNEHIGEYLRVWVGRRIVEAECRRELRTPPVELVI